jgi:hypothetical protein
MLRGTPLQRPPVVDFAVSHGCFRLSFITLFWYYYFDVLRGRGGDSWEVKRNQAERVAKLRAKVGNKSPSTSQKKFANIAAWCRMTPSSFVLLLAVFAAACAAVTAFSGGISPQLECALCGLAVNEVEGLIQENKTSAEIIQAIEDDICSHLSGDLKALCDQVASLAPVIADKLIDHETAGAICIDVKLCAGPRNDRPDPIAMPKSKYLSFLVCVPFQLLIAAQAS